MTYYRIQSKLRPIRDPETKKHLLIPGSSWKTIVEYEEGEPLEEIQQMLEYQIRNGSIQMNLPVEEVRKYYRIKEVYVDETYD